MGGSRQPGSRCWPARGSARPYRSASRLPPRPQKTGRPRAERTPGTHTRSLKRLLRQGGYPVTRTGDYGKSSLNIQPHRAAVSGRWALYVAWRQAPRPELPDLFPRTAGSTPATSYWPIAIASGLRMPPQLSHLAAGAGPPCCLPADCPGSPARDPAEAWAGHIRSQAIHGVPAGEPTSFRAGLRDASEQGTNFRLPVPAVPAKCADRRKLASLRPPGDGLRVHAEHGRDLRRRQQRFSLGCACRHMYGLSSWTSTALLRCTSSWPRVEPAVDVPI